MISPIGIEQAERRPLILLELYEICDIISCPAIKGQTGSRDIKAVFGAIAGLGHFAAAVGSELFPVAGHIAEIEHEAGMKRELIVIAAENEADGRIISAGKTEGVERGLVGVWNNRGLW